MNEETLKRMVKNINPYGVMLAVSKGGEAFYFNDYKLATLDGKKAVVLFNGGEYITTIHIRDIVCVVNVS